jgi:excinuclease UvrABC nuclease subunit
MEKLIENLDFKAVFDMVMSLEKFSIKDRKSADGRGIYFLWRDDIVTYIGISQCISNRLFNSRNSHCIEKDFNYYSFINIELENKELEYYEYNLISLFKPSDNGTNKGFKNFDYLDLSYKEKKEAIHKKQAINRCMLISEIWNIIDLDLKNYV